MSTDCGCDNNQPAPRTNVLSRIMNKIFVSDEEAKARMKICKSCENFIPLTAQCKICFCFLEAKTKLVGFTCADTPPKW